jgi:hypothetical protein
MQHGEKNMIRCVLALVVLGAVVPSSFAAVPEPVSVPDGGATLLILGLATVGIEALRRVFSR